MAQRFKLVNKSRITNNRIRLVKTPTSNTQIDPLYGAMYENTSEVGICLAPNTIISCVGAKVETDEILIDGDGWSVEIDGQLVELPTPKMAMRMMAMSTTATTTYEQMVELLEANGVRVTEYVGHHPTPIVCDGALSKEELMMQDGGWMLEVDGESMGGPYDLATLDNYSRRREVRILVPEPLTCKINNPDRFHYQHLDLSVVEGIYNAVTGERLLSGVDINQYGETSGGDLLIGHDGNYGMGYFQNLTGECLLIEIRAYPGQPLNADLEYYEQDGAIENRDGVYFISLGPVTFKVPTLSYDFYEQQGGVFTPFSQSTDSAESPVYVRFFLSLDGPLDPQGVEFTFEGVPYRLVPSQMELYVPISRIGPNHGFKSDYYVISKDIVSLTEGMNINHPGIWEEEIVRITDYWNSIDTTNVEIDLTVDGQLTKFVGNSNLLEHPGYDRPSLSTGSVVTIQAPSYYAGAIVALGHNATPAVGTLDENGYLQFTVTQTSSSNLVGINFFDPDFIDERIDGLDYGFTELRSVNFNF